MLFSPKSIDEACVQTQQLENIDHKKGQPSGSKHKESQDATKGGKKKWKGKDNKTIVTAHLCKDPKNHCNHYDIDGHTEEKCWNLHLEFNPKNNNKDAKRKNLLATKSRKELESNSNLDKNIIYNKMKKNNGG